MPSRLNSSVVVFPVSPEPSRLSTPLVRIDPVARLGRRVRLLTNAALPATYGEAKLVPSSVTAAGLLSGMTILPPARHVQPIAACDPS
jgi:hypothetical protein